ncbi:MAG: SpoIIE family protein phosphatase [Thermoflexales bacterium]|nr:SpoIIE family protein phosphatase [Thermoflexales bacterium]
MGVSSTFTPYSLRLPPQMVGRPFGVDEAGRPINRNKGVIIIATIQHMLACVAERVVRLLPPGTPAAEREARVAQAQDAAFDELVRRLNEAVPDPRYHVTREYLLNEGHAYSVEFDAFLSHICYELADDPRFHFNRGAKSIPPSILFLARPFPLSQVYNLLPRFAGKFADTEFRVVHVAPGSATIQWYSTKELAMLPDALRRAFIAYSCQYIQGTLSSIPKVHSGLPMAGIREIRCQLNGDECCEWEFSWQEPPKAPAWRGLFSRRAQAQAAPGSDHIASMMVAQPASPPPDDSSMPPLPARLAGPPFGANASGEPIRDITGSSVKSVIEYMQSSIQQRLAQELPAHLSMEECAARIAQAQSDALDELVERLNGVMPDRRYQVSREYLLDASHYYSHEFNLFVNEFARLIADDPYLFFQRGLRSTPPALINIVRPLSLRQIYTWMPRLVAKVTETDIRVVRVTPGSAVIQWYPHVQFSRLPQSLHKRYARMGCQAYQGVFAAAPAQHSNLPLAKIRESRCVLRGDECCEWEFIWQVVKPGWGLGLWMGVAATLVLLAWTALRWPAWQALAVVMALLPLGMGWLAATLRSSEYERQRQENILLDHREKSEEQYDAMQQANADLQASLLTLKERVSELTTLHDVGQALSTTLDVDELLDKSLRAVISHLGFDRAMILLVDEDKRVIGHGHAIGGSPEMIALVEQMELPLDEADGFAAQIIRGGRPLLIQSVAQLMHQRALSYVTAWGASSFLAVPLITQGKAVGLLGVDNAVTGRAIAEDIQDLLVTVCSQIAGAVDSARLYETLERRVAERTAELRESQAQLQASYEREMAIAYQLQASLLPAEVPAIDGLDIAGFSQSARHVGGDLYNYFVFDQDRLGIAVGDVSGKGIQAALMMALSFGLLTNQVRRDSTPADLLAEMNVQIYPHTCRTRLNTALCYLALERSDQGWQAYVANAGLIAPLLRHADGRVEWLDLGGLPLGVQMKSDYGSASHRLVPGGLLILSSDGIVEAMNPAGQLYSFDRLTACVAAAPLGASACQVRDWILADVRAYAGGAEVNDDLTLVVVSAAQA